MILSVSRRTDIPAFYTDWFFNRLREGFVEVKNPFNKKQVSRISLDPANIELIVFWTKNPILILERIQELNTYKIPYYFHITVTPYGKDIELNIHNKLEIIEAVKKLSKQIGHEKVIWRYDPILLTDKYCMTYHFEKFEFLANQFNTYTDKCIISFIDTYKKNNKRMQPLDIKEIEPENKIKLAKQIATIAKKYNIEVQSCAEEIHLESLNIKHAKCVDYPNTPKDKNQRSACNCVKSVDIGEYKTCKHNCLYCYAN